MLNSEMGLCRACAARILPRWGAAVLRPYSSGWRLRISGLGETWRRRKMRTLPPRRLSPAAFQAEMAR
jgi:hypothetical protein